jgi:hypothetical protein
MKLATISLLGVLAVGAAYASQFTSASARISGSKLVVSTSLRGLSFDQRTTLRATAKALVTYVCVNKGGNVPKADNKEHTVTRTVTTSRTFTSDGRTLTATLTLAPPSAGSFKCPAGLEAKISRIRYSDVRVHDVTNRVSKGISGTFSANLLSSKK